MGRHFSCIKIAFSTTKMASSCGEIYVFHISKATFPALSHEIFLGSFILVVSYRSFDLKPSIYILSLKLKRNRQIVVHFYPHFCAYLVLVAIQRRVNLYRTTMPPISPIGNILLECRELIRHLKLLALLALDLGLER